MSADKAAGMRLEFEDATGASREERFDFVVMATGHQWPKEPEARFGYFLSQSPSSALKRINAVDVGIRGSSLTAIDAAAPSRDAGSPVPRRLGARPGGDEGVMLHKPITIDPSG